MIQKLLVLNAVGLYNACFCITIVLVNSSAVVGHIAGSSYRAAL